MIAPVLFWTFTLIREVVMVTIPGSSFTLKLDFPQVLLTTKMSLPEERMSRNIQFG